MTFAPQTPASHALLVIDVQASFTARPYWSDADLPAYLAEQNALIEGFAKAGQPIVRVFHVEEQGAFSPGGGLVRPLDGLADFSEALTIHKHRHSAFAGTRLADWLQERGIRNITVSGIRTEQCCETTTRDASDRGLAVTYVTAATLTFAMQHPNGQVYSAQDIKARTELVLAERFARVQSVSQALASGCAEPLQV